MKGFEQIDHSVIWENGSRTYTNGKSDPPKSWQYPPLNTLKPVEIADETPAQGGVFQAPVPVAETRPPVVLKLPDPPTPAPPLAQIDEPPTAPQGIAVGEPAPGTRPEQPEQPSSVSDTLGRYSDQVTGWWGSLSGTTKIVVGGAAVIAAVSALSSKGPR